MLRLFKKKYSTFYLNNKDCNALYFISVKWSVESIKTLFFAFDFLYINLHKSDWIVIFIIKNSTEEWIDITKKSANNVIVQKIYFFWA